VHAALALRAAREQKRSFFYGTVEASGSRNGANAATPSFKAGSRITNKLFSCAANCVQKMWRRRDMR
jgi:hypothetical protein